MSGNPGMAPRSRSCKLCREVGAIEHVALLLYDEDGNKLPTRPVVDYLRSIGSVGSPQALYNRIITHRNHIDRWLERGGVVIPAQQESGEVKVLPPMGDQRWLDVNQTAMNLGNEALRSLAARMAAGELEPKDEIALAKLGVGAASTRGALEQKGRALTGIDRLLQLAAGGLGNAPQEGT